MMEGKSSIIQGLPLITVILALLLFIIFRVVSRFKKKALGDTGGKDLPTFQVENKAKEDPEMK